MAVSFNIDVDSSRLQSKLRRLAKSDNLQKPLKQSGTYMERSISMRFRNANWAPLSASTLRIHPKRSGGKPLNDTGTLKRSVTSQAQQKLERTSLRYGTNLNYAPLHNFGGRTSWGTTVPQREFLYFDSRDNKQINTIFRDYVRRELAK